MSSHSAGRAVRVSGLRAPGAVRHLPGLHRVHHRAERRTAVGIGATVLALIGTVLALLGVATALGLSSVTFASGSMQPAIAEGSIAITRTVDPADLGVGDVASVVSTTGERVTHRVTSVEDLGDGATALTLRGDANPSDDPAPYVVDVADQVLAVVPGLGGVDAVPLVLGAAVGWVLVAGVLLRRRWDLGAGATLVLASVLVVTAGGASGTSAFWTDAATATTAPWTTVATTPSPSTPGCTDHLDHVDASFTNVGQRYRYRATLHRLDTGAQVAGEQYLAEGTGATITRDVLRTGFGSSSLAQITASGQRNFVVRVHAVPVGSTTWLSPTFVSVPVHFTSGYATMRCGNDTTTTVTITSLGSDSGSSSTDFVTNVAANTLSGTGEPGATIVLTRGGTQIGTATVNASGTWTSTGFTLTAGSQSITATATDDIGNTATASRTTLLDQVAPTVTPSAACSSVGNAVTGVSGATWCKVTSLSWSATYADTGGSGLVPGSGSQYDNDGAGFTSYTTPVSLAEKSGRVVQARATDVAGNVTTVSNTYWIDGTAPTLTVTYPHGGLSLLRGTFLANLSTTCGSTAAGCGTVTDAVSGPATVQWGLRRDVVLSPTRYLGPDRSTYDGTASTRIAATVNAGAGTWAATVPNVGAVYPAILASYTLSAYNATDAAGNVTAGPVTGTISILL